MVPVKKFNICYFGIISLGEVSTTVYPTLLPEQIKHIITDSDSRLVFVEDAIQLEKIKSIIEDCPKLKTIVVMDNSLEKEEKGVVNLNSFMIIDQEYIKNNTIL